MVIEMSETKISPKDVERILIDIIKKNSNDELLIDLLKFELSRNDNNGKNKEKLLQELKDAATIHNISDEQIDKIFYWITHPVRDIRQIILTKTIEELLKDEKYYNNVFNILCQTAGKEGVELIFKWVKDGIMTLEQAIYTIVYPTNDIY